MDPYADGYSPPPVAHPSPDGILFYPSVPYAAVLGYRPMLLDLRVPAGDGPHPLIVWLHGGAWWKGGRRRLPASLAVPGVWYRRLLDRGYAVASADYRLSAEARYPAQLHDVKAAVRWLRGHAAELSLDADRVALWGESAGGHLAALAALTADSGPESDGRIGLVGPSSAVRAVVDWYGPSTFLRWPDWTDAEDTPDALLIGGSVQSRPAEAAAASPLEHVHAGAPPFLCVHGGADEIVPYEHSVWLTEALREHGVRADLLPVPGGDHGFGNVDAGPLVDASLDFLDEVLAKP